LALGAVLALAAVIVGIGDNPPGILLLFLAATTFILAFTHAWQTARQYRRLLYASVPTMPLLVILHELFETLGAGAGRPTVTGRLLESAGDAFFFLAVFLCPVAILVALFGALLRWAERL
jgi:hypothetical protein